MIILYIRVRHHLTYYNNLKFLNIGLGGCGEEVIFYDTKLGKYVMYDSPRSLNKEYSDWLNADEPDIDPETGEVDNDDGTITERLNKLRLLKYPELGV